MNKIFAFIKKDFMLKKSYRFAFLWGIFSSIFSFLIFYFIDLLMDKRITAFLAPYGINYFSYVFLGVIIFNFSGAGPGSISQKVYEEKICGSLEEILILKENLFLFLLSASIYNFILSLGEALVYLSAGFIFFKIDFSSVNITSMIIIMFFSFFSFSALGILSSVFVLLFKRGNPLAFLLSSAEGFLGGAYFPAAVLPFGLYKLSYIFPVYWSIRASQKAFYSGASFLDIWPELSILFLFSVFLFPASFFLFGLALNKAKIKGSLNQY
ncbi:MAG: ABC transporter permease [Elusimicrobia bacterium]|nr:ABC transporter permease [Elusimicrobiota bacterium]